MALCGTYYGYRCGCRCDECRHARSAARRAQRALERGELPVVPLAQRRAERAAMGPKFDTPLANLRHALTKEEHDLIVAKRGRSVTQEPMQIHRDSRNHVGDGLTPFERIIAEGTL
jgi:hypothetical protein